MGLYTHVNFNLCMMKNAELILSVLYTFGHFCVNQKEFLTFKNPSFNLFSHFKPTLYICVFCCNFYLLSILFSRINGMSVKMWSFTISHILLHKVSYLKKLHFTILVPCKYCNISIEPFIKKSVLYIRFFVKPDLLTSS